MLITCAQEILILPSTVAPVCAATKTDPHSECYFTLSKSILLRQGSTNRSSGRGSEALLIGLAPALAYFVGSDYAGSR